MRHCDRLRACEERGPRRGFSISFWPLDPLRVGEERGPRQSFSISSVSLDGSSWDRPFPVSTPSPFPSCCGAATASKCVRPAKRQPLEELSDPCPVRPEPPRHFRQGGLDTQQKHRVPRGASKMPPSDQTTVCPKLVPSFPRFTFCGDFRTTTGGGLPGVSVFPLVVI